MTHIIAAMRWTIRESIQNKDPGRLPAEYTVSLADDITRSIGEKNAIGRSREQCTDFPNTHGAVCVC